MVQLHSSLSHANYKTSSNNNSKHPRKMSFINKYRRNPPFIKLCILHKIDTSRGLPLKNYRPNKGNYKKMIYNNFLNEPGRLTPLPTFHGAAMGQVACFDGAAMGQVACFDGAAMGQVACFDGAAMGQVACFDGAAMLSPVVCKLH